MKWNMSEWLGRAELKGFKAANKAHKIAINVIFCVIGYELYAFFRDYNRFFLEARKVTKEEALEFAQGQPINKVTLKEERG